MVKMRNLEMIDWYFNGTGLKKKIAKILASLLGISPSALTIYTFKKFNKRRFSCKGGGIR